MKTLSDMKSMKVKKGDIEYRCIYCHKIDMGRKGSYVCHLCKKQKKALASEMSKKWHREHELKLIDGHLVYVDKLPSKKGKNKV